MGEPCKPAHAHVDVFTSCAVASCGKLRLTLCALCSAVVFYPSIVQGEAGKKAYAHCAHCCMQVMQEVGQEVEGYMTSIFNKDRPDKDAEVVFLTKFIVTPDIALDFIAEVKKVRELLFCIMRSVSCAFKSSF